MYRFCALRLKIILIKFCPRPKTEHGNQIAPCVAIDLTPLIVGAGR